MRGLILLAIAAVVGAQDDFNVIGDHTLTMRPGAQSETRNYALTPAQPHTLIYDSLPNQVSFQYTQYPDASGGTLRFTSLGAISIEGQTNIRAVVNGSQTTAPERLTIIVDARPTVSSALAPATFAEDLPDQAALITFADTPNTGLTASVTGTTGQVTATCEPVSGSQFRLRVTSGANFVGSTSVTVTVTDALGPTSFPLSIAFTNTNDPPTLALTRRSNLSVDPRIGAAVRLLDGITIGPGDDTTVTTEGATGLTLSAEVVGGTVADLLTIAGDGSYRIDGATISSTAGGQTTTVATWSRLQNQPWRLAVTLVSAVPGVAMPRLNDLAKLLRYSHLQAHAAVVERAIAITVSEPASNGTSAIQTCSVRVMPVNAPPDVAAAALVVAPDQSASVPIVITDNEPLGGLVVSVLDPLPSGGTVTPLSCTAAQANAGYLIYQHRDGDTIADEIRLRVSDGVNPPVTTVVPVTIRTTPDRLSIISDPLLCVRASPWRTASAPCPMGRRCRSVIMASPFPPGPPTASASTRVC